MAIFDGWTRRREERRLVRKAQGGDPAARGELWEYLRGYVFAVCRAKLVDPQDAEDAAVLTFVRLVHGLRHLDPERPLVPYAAAIARNTCARLAEQRRRTPQPVPLDVLGEEGGNGAEPAAGPRCDPELACCLKESVTALQGGLAELPEEYRLLLEYHHGLGIPATRLHLYWPDDLPRWGSRATLFRWLREARAALRLRLAEREFDEATAEEYLEMTWALREVASHDA